MKTQTVSCNWPPPANTNTETPLVIGPAWIDETWHINGGLTVAIDNHVFRSSSKYTILELGWAIYLAHEDVPEVWLKQRGEVCPAADGRSELASGNGTLLTSHPILVALSLMGWWHLEGKPIPLHPGVAIPSFAEAVQLVRAREIQNAFNRSHKGTVPGLARWSPSETQTAIPPRPHS